MHRLILDTKSNLIIDNVQKLSKKLDQGGSMSTHNATSKAILAASSLVMLVNNMMIVSRPFTLATRAKKSTPIWQSVVFKSLQVVMKDWWIHKSPRQFRTMS
jgi:hypothetical protein